ncbi:hypothetical protein [Sporosarcina sp. ACRSL]|uniref:hypothetical protein n=1 Tax=Sporosarcina sp. ACRSL TaxID=2918215 RepID=UPI001EF3FCC7|nr:hypothetical protein [Sporosarcina sp. ACRSL]
MRNALSKRLLLDDFNVVLGGCGEISGGFDEVSGGRNVASGGFDEVLGGHDPTSGGSDGGSGGRGFQIIILHHIRANYFETGRIYIRR